MEVEGTIIGSSFLFPLEVSVGLSAAICSLGGGSGGVMLVTNSVAH